MVRTVKVVKVLSADKSSGSTSNDSVQANTPSGGLKRCRFLVRVPSGGMSPVKKIPNSQQVLIPVNAASVQGVGGQQNVERSATHNERVESNVPKPVVESNSKNITTSAPPPKKHEVKIINLPNGEKGIIVNNSRPSVADTSSVDDNKNTRDNEGIAADGSDLYSKCCYPPNEHTCHLLKLLGAGEILSYGELDDIITYANYLKSRKLVTEHLLKKKIFSIISESNDAPASDCEPPIIHGKMKLPSFAQKRYASHRQESNPAKMPRLLEVLQSNDIPCGAILRRRNRAMTGYRLRSKESNVSCEMCGSRINETHLKMHNKVCKGVLIRRHRRTTDDTSATAEEKRDRPCPRCDKVLTCDKDFEMHMAVAHKFYWRLEFDEEEDFKTWFREEGLDETMYIATCQTAADFRQKVYYCAINRNQKKTDVKCPCRLVVKKGQNGIIVRYFVLHNHSERFVRRVMSVECRDMIIKLLKDGLSNYEILKRIKDSYPKTSMNHYITRESITRLRYRYHRNSRSSKKTETRMRKRRPKKPNTNEDRVLLATYMDDKEHEVWSLPELQCTQIGATNAYQDGQVDNCSVIDESTNF